MKMRNRINGAKPARPPALPKAKDVQLTPQQTQMLLVCLSERDHANRRLEAFLAGVGVSGPVLSLNPNTGILTVAEEA